MKFSSHFESYRLLVGKADQAFSRMKKEYGDCIKCKPQCSDCCHAVFGLFLMEALYLQQHFGRLNKKERRDAILRARKSDKELAKIEEKLKAHEGDPQMKPFSLSKERVRCPLLNEKDKCILYAYRPITCRVYGIPTAIHGRGHVCGKAAFKRGETYPTFDLDSIYRALYHLSKSIITEAGGEVIDRASLLISVSKAIKTPVRDIVIGSIE
jgi:Fe-S-cluster containining protein